MLSTKEARAHVNDIVAEATVGINGFFNERRGRVQGIVGVTVF